MNSINDRTLYLAGLIGGTLIEDTYWKVFGFKSRPKRGSLFNKFVDKALLAKERFLQRELILLSTIDVIEAVLSKSISDGDKQVYIIGVLSELITPLLQSHIFESEEDFFKYLAEGLKEYSQQAFVEVFSSRAKKAVDDKNAKSLIAGGIIATSLYVTDKQFIFDRKIIGKQILPINEEEKLNSSFDNSRLQMYASFAKDLLTQNYES